MKESVQKELGGFSDKEHIIKKREALGWNVPHEQESVNENSGQRRRMRRRSRRGWRWTVRFTQSE